MKGMNLLASQDAETIVTKYVCPALGAILSNLTQLAPVNSIVEAISTGRLGDINPVPFAILSANVLGWTAYGFIKKDIFVLLANMPGIPLTLWYNISCMKLQYLEAHYKKYDEHHPHNDRQISQQQNDNHYDPLITTESNGRESDQATHLQNNRSLSPIVSLQEVLLIVSMLVWMVVLSVVIMVSFTRNERINIVGITANVNLVLFYASPLSTIRNVIKTGDSSSIHRILLVMILFNSFFWTVYGIAIDDVMIATPNMTGFLLGLIQGILCIVYPTKEKHQINTTENNSSYDSSPTESETQQESLIQNQINPF